MKGIVLKNSHPEYTDNLQKSPIFCTLYDSRLLIDPQAREFRKQWHFHCQDTRSKVVAVAGDNNDADDDCYYCNNCCDSDCNVVDCADDADVDNCPRQEITCQYPGTHRAVSFACSQVDT